MKFELHGKEYLNNQKHLRNHEIMDKHGFGQVANQEGNGNKLPA